MAAFAHSGDGEEIGSMISFALRKPAFSKKTWGIALLIVLTIGAVVYFAGLQQSTLETFKSQRDRLREWTEQHYLEAVVIFMVIYCLQVAIFLPGDALLTLLGGFLFGSVAGTLYVNIGATAGATLALLASRYLFREWVEHKFGSRFKEVREGFSRHSFNYLLGLRLIPVMPFWLVNLLGGLTRMKVLPYALATSLGMLPASFIYAYAGRQLGTLNSLSEITSPSVLLALFLLALLTFSPIVYHEWIAKKHQGQG